MTGIPTGDLLRLANWWQENRPRDERTLAWIVDPSDASAAEKAVNSAVDSGATVIALLALGDSDAARAVVSRLARATPAQVRDQPAGTSDLEWMSQVAAIRDARADETAQTSDQAIAACAAALAAATKRATPVVFDGLIAHAAAMSAGEFDATWLPASSSTDPAITLVQEHWKVRPAVDLHTRGGDDLSIRAVFALLDLVED
jgi:NaMN:DMB phosphoribosyltransferase